MCKTPDEPLPTYIIRRSLDLDWRQLVIQKYLVKDTNIQFTPTDRTRKTDEFMIKWRLKNYMDNKTSEWPDINMQHINDYLEEMRSMALPDPWFLPELPEILPTTPLGIRRRQENFDEKKDKDAKKRLKTELDQEKKKKKPRKN